MIKRLGRFKKLLFLDLLVILIITVPAYFRLLNNYYFSMHDDQHLARLFLLDKAIHQGYLYPRWVDTLGFNFGYPLFNFYPPLIYYTGEVFHLLGLSLIWSIKLTFILGFIIGAWGIFLYTKKLVGRLPAYLSATLYTFFFYHAVLIYVRGALAEFFLLAILPYFFLAFENLKQKPNLKNSLWFAMVFALLILTHPLIAFPTLLYLGFFFIFYTIQSKEKLRLAIVTLTGGILGLALSAFYWLPSLFERQYTLVDSILTKELANYKIHFICPAQFWNSPWGYGGSILGCFDGFTFQLGKIHMALTLIAVVLSLFYLFKGKLSERLSYFYFYLFLLFFSLFMTTSYSSIIWDNLKYLWYLQFPWRFLTFAAFFISISGAYCIFFISDLAEKFTRLNIAIVLFFTLMTIFIYQKYFIPQQYVYANDKQLTSFENIAWYVSRSSFEFSPQGIKTTKSETETTIPAITKESLNTQPYTLVSGSALVTSIKNKMAEKEWNIYSTDKTIFRFNNFNFPGWKAYIDSKEASIKDNNNFKLITVVLPKGSHDLKIIFEDTPIRTTASIISFLAFILVSIHLWKLKKHMIR